MKTILRIFMPAIIVGIIAYILTIPRTAESTQQVVSNQMEKKEMKPQNPISITIETNLGNMKLELYPDKAPLTVQNFVQYIESNFFDGLIFHRVIKNFMIQGGGMMPGLEQKQPTFPPIKNEAEISGLRNIRGSIAMARTNQPHSATSQFFINHKDNAMLDWDKSPDGYGYCVFGKMIEGFEVLDKIASVETGSKGFHQDVPKTDVVIQRITINKDK